ncbi:hypothetical protein GOP47_0004368 [Adiantum capillus-veneris]|uniref:Uncharacterized protein n=1 Tax=Adiantum capillus-veneris TaxID=13818 RepID=A0A9D4V843_ADICA|nr:hypothetical protein GOP47_0004368 [Adiantum capillus-veneris]
MFNNQGWQRQQQYSQWRPQFNQRGPPFRGNFNSSGGPRFGGWQNSRPSLGGKLGSAAAVAELAATTTRMESTGVELSRGESATTAKRASAAIASTTSTVS